MISKLKEVIAVVLVGSLIFIVMAIHRRSVSDNEIMVNISTTSSKKPRVPPAIYDVDQHDSDGQTQISLKNEIQLNTKEDDGSKEDEDEVRSVDDGLIRMAPDLFKKIPTQFLPEYKNPCWMKNSRLNCLPYFYIIGMPKCGTTDLWDKITAHPDVIETVPKEPHWWSRRRLGWTSTPIHTKQVKKIRAMTGKKDDRSLEWYLNWFQAFAVDKVRNSFTIKDDGEKYYPKVFGDASVSTAWYIGQDWKRLYPNATEPPYVNADLMHALQPTAKIIMAVRNPTNREYSMYYYNGGKNAEDFHRNMTSKIQCYQNCLAEHSSKYCAYARTCNMEIGLYFPFLNDWVKAYGRSGVHVIRLEDWYSEPGKEYRRLLQFLELRHLTNEEIDAITSQKTKNVNNKKKKKKKPMLDKTKKALESFYRPYNKDMGRLLDDYRFAYYS